MDEHNNNEVEIEKLMLMSPGKKLKVDEITNEEYEEYDDNNYWKLPGLSNFSLEDL